MKAPLISSCSRGNNYMQKCLWEPNYRTVREYICRIIGRFVKDICRIIGRFVKMFTELSSSSSRCLPNYRTVREDVCRIIGRLVKMFAELLGGSSRCLPNYRAVCQDVCRIIGRFVKMFAEFMKSENTLRFSLSQNILSQMYPTHRSTRCSFKTYFNIIFQYAAGNSFIFSSGFVTTFHFISPMPLACVYFLFDHRYDVWWRLWIMKILITQFFEPPVILFSLNRNMFFNILF
jgi:hypothetical protein